MHKKLTEYIKKHTQITYTIPGNSCSSKFISFYFAFVIRFVLFFLLLLLLLLLFTIKFYVSLEFITIGRIHKKFFFSTENENNNFILFELVRLCSTSTMQISFIFWYMIHMPKLLNFFPHSQKHHLNLMEKLMGSVACSTLQLNKNQCCWKVHVPRPFLWKKCTSTKDAHTKLWPTNRL